MALFAPHPAFDRVFAPGSLSLGLVLPVSRGGETVPDPGGQLAVARRADELGFTALWVRDVPLNSPDYPDPIEHLDPWVHLGALAASTRRIALVTGAIVAPLRHPIHVAKAALSVDRLSGGRMILGLGSGDRPAEFEAFGAEVAQASEQYRDRWRAVEALMSGAGHVGPYGTETGTAVRPRPVHGHVPMLAIGSSGQTIDWVARNANGWATSAGSDDGMDGLRMSSMTYRIATGRDAGRKVVTLQTLPGDAGSLEGDAGKVGGFSLHAGVAAEAHESHKLEKLCRYIRRRRPASAGGRRFRSGSAAESPCPKDAALLTVE